MPRNDKVFPGPGNAGWPKATPESRAIDPSKLAAAVAFAEAHESKWPRDLEDAGNVPGLTQIEPAPWNEFIGPLTPRGGPAGLILKGGRIVAEWGDP
ncbi:MAG: hypothetical protein O2944_08365, partial [Proteobacteria bacterium]|nr:hypothetical protein [Pseudomonadota bacterium]